MVEQEESNKNYITAGVITISQTFIIYRKYTRSQQQHKTVEIIRGFPKKKIQKLITN